MGLMLGIDTGGTYTDAVLFDEELGVRAKAKALTTRFDLSVGVREALDRVLREAADCTRIGMVSLSTTLATNALVEGDGEPVGLLLVGQPQALLGRAGLGEALGEDPVAFIPGGHRASGEEQEALDLDAARQAIERQRARVGAFAVAGYFAVRNAAHELAVRDLVLEICGLPVTCSHQMSPALDAPRRALTALLNARLIPLIDRLVRAVRQLLRERAIEAPLMVVKGDGSLVGAEEALHRPVETILSGPAASVVGARHLTGERDALVADVGGTTTDIALLRDGRPSLDARGATVGGWRTMVEAVAVHTYGLGGDSELHPAEGGGLRLGPRRAIPLSLLAVHWPGLLEALEQAGAAPVPVLPRFAVRVAASLPAGGRFSRFEREIWEATAERPASIAVLGDDLITRRALERLARRGLVALAAFTPSDASHVLDLQQHWNRDAALLGARCWVAHWAGAGWPHPPEDARELARWTVQRMQVQSAIALVDSALLEQGLPALASTGPLGLRLVGDAVAGRTAAAEEVAGLVEIGLRLRCPLIGIGAPAATFYPPLAERLGTRAVVPEHAEVCNALGAVASGVVQNVQATITAPAEDVFRVHLPDGVRDFASLEAAVADARARAGRLASEQALRAGAAAVEVGYTREDTIAAGVQGRDVFVQSTVVARAAGRPRHAR